MAEENAKEPKPKKTIMLKQYLVSGSPPGAKTVWKAAFILQTCPKNANDEFRRLFPGYTVWNTSVTAESRLTKEDLSRDLWAERQNWMLFDRKSDDDPFARF